MMNESQVAFEVSQAERRRAPLDSRIGDALANGLFVVYVYAVAHCPRTDAVMGEDRAFEASFSTEAEAQALTDDLADHGVDVSWIAPPVHGCDGAPVVDDCTLF